MKKIILIVFSGLAGAGLYAQDGESVDQLFQTKYETPLTIDMQQQEEEMKDPVEGKKKKKKLNPKIYYGIKTKRGFARTGYGDQALVELFHFLKDKDYVEPDPYCRDFYWYDFKKKKIVNSLKARQGYSGVMHGHYVKKLGEQVVEEGYFYKGMKHGRWVKYNRHDILLDKEIYWKGFPKESRLAYYDFKRNRLMEVIPVHFGEREGEYFAYHSDGKLAATGVYRFDHKVGLWREYYNNQRIKREVQYPEDPFDETPPVILKEWDREGNVIYDRKKFEARANN